MATNHTSAALVSPLQEAADYRSFLRAYLESKKMNLSDFARTGGFSRSFPSDVIAGKRRLTAKSAPAFEKSLHLPAAGKKLFRLLVALEEPDVYIDIDRSRLPQMLVELRSKSWKTEPVAHRKTQEREWPSATELLADSRSMGVYAAAGEPQCGATRTQIEKRTRLFGQELERHLKALIRTGLLQQQDEVFYPKDLHLFLQTSEQSQLLTSVFQKASRLAAHRVAEAEGTSEMFFASQFCVHEESLPELKAALKKVILQFVDDSINPQGDRVVRLLTALHF